MSMLYCPRCDTNVLATREDIDICLAIILLIFTAGIGLIVYLIYYYAQEENRCIHCRSICLPQKTDQGINLITPVSNPYHYNQETQQVQLLETKSGEGEGSKYCNNCGVKLNRLDMNYCPFCGTNI